jgi:stage II sporulation protein AB (anti-sigma F factor)
VNIYCKIEGNEIHITVEDKGSGIENVATAMQPLFTTGSAEERSGMGFTVMETFMDRLEVESALDIGTKVHMVKKIGGGVPDNQDDDN